MCVINNNTMKTSANSGSEELTISHRGSDITFNVELEVLYFYRAAHLIYLVALDGSEYPLRRSLSSIMEQVANSSFLQINRSVLFNFNFVETYKPGVRRDTLELTFKKSIQSVISGKIKNLFTVTREHLGRIRDRLNHETQEN